MKITQLTIDGFGIWNGLRIDGLNDSINVFYGPNEAGKTTLLHFVRSVFFGFSKQRRERYLPPVAAGSAGGSVVITELGESYVLSRHLDAAGYESALEVLNSQGEPASSDSLARLLNEIDEPTFNGVFAIGLRDFQELGTLSDSGAGEFLFRVAAGLNGANLFEVLAELENSRNRLLAVDDRPCEIVHLLGQQERLRGEIHELKSLTVQYAQALSDARERDAELQRLETDNRTLAAQLAQLQTACKIVSAWDRRAAIDQQLLDHGPATSIGDNLLDPWEELGKQLTAHRRRVAACRARRRELAVRVRRIKFNTALVRESARIESFCDQREWIATLERQSESVAAQLSQVRAQLESTQASAGWSAAQAPGQIDAKAFGRLRMAARQCRESHKRWKVAEAAQRATKEAIAALTQQIAGGLADYPEKSLSSALEAAGSAVTQLRRRLQLDEQVQRSADTLKDLQAQRLELLEKQVVPGWLVTAMAGVFAFGVVIFLVGLVLPLNGSQALGLGVAVLGLLGVIGVVLGKFSIERHNQNRLELCERQLEMHSVQARRGQEEREALDKQLPKGGGALTMRLQAAEKELAKLEELIPLDARRQGLERDLAAAQATLEQAGQERAARRNAWRKAIVAIGLPKDFAPAQLRGFSRSNQRFESLRSKADLLAEEHKARTSALAAILERLQPLAAIAGISGEGKRVSEQLASLREELDKAVAAAAKRETLVRRQRMLRRRQSKLLRAVRTLKARRGHLLQQAGVANGAALRELAAQQAEYASLKRDRMAAQAEIDRGMSAEITESTIEPWIAIARDSENAQLRLKDLNDQVDQIAGRMRQAAQEQGQLHERTNTLAADRRLATKQLELDSVTARLARAVRRWQVLAVTWSLLDKLRREYEQERQPETLRVASGYFERLTEGRYRKIWTPLGERILRVEDGQRQTLPVDVLSRGTREQLFLALRLSLVKMYARRGIRAPLILDDLLVNFDAARARAAVLVLRDFAEEGHQLFVFTCHEHIARLFHGLGVAVRPLPGTMLGDMAFASREAKLASVPVPMVAQHESKAPPAAASTTPRPARSVRRKERERPAAPSVQPVATPPRRNPWDAEEFEGEFAERAVVGNARVASNPHHAVEENESADPDTEAA